MIRHAFAGLLTCTALFALGCSCCHKNTCRPSCPPPAAPCAPAVPPPSGFDPNAAPVVPGPPPGGAYGAAPIR
jgi:hypothetical protein